MVDLWWRISTPFGRSNGHGPSDIGGAVGAPGSVEDQAAQNTARAAPVSGGNSIISSGTLMLPSLEGELLLCVLFECHRSWARSLSLLIAIKD